MTRNYWLIDKRDRRKGIRSSGLCEPYARSMSIPFKVGEVLAIMVGERLSKLGEPTSFEEESFKVEYDENLQQENFPFLSFPLFKIFRYFCREKVANSWAGVIKNFRQRSISCLEFSLRIREQACGM